MSRDPFSLLIRVNAGSQIGLGHVMRCLALAQAVRDRGGDATFVSAAGAALPIESRLKSEGFKTTAINCAIGSEEDATHTAALAAKLQAAWVVADGYQFDASYQKNLKDCGCRLMVIDDFRHSSHYFADIVLDQSISHQQTDLYDSKEPHTKLLVGADYVLLRREFVKRAPLNRAHTLPAKKILVTLGGGDTAEITRKVLRALSSVKTGQIECKVVLGPGFPKDEMLDAIASSSRYSVSIVRSPESMPGLMAWADLAISGAGSTVWELAFMGVPALVVILADNQGPLARRLENAGILSSLGWHTELTEDRIASAINALIASPERRMSMSRAGRELIDGNGADRVVDCLHSPSVRLRRATTNDSLVVWKWANDPGVRLVSFSPDPIPLESHLE
ncbi:MAG TPA: UDP-2,4-diacetamido-2,4,6-trideoxy-beta-L-altropyranose hydrolase, partial [Blastocatellia bacterium]